MKNLFNKKSKDQNIPLRVLYKKVNQEPEVKIINDVNILKKKIIERNLDIIPYEKLFIICNNKKLMEEMRTNIFLPLKRIGGDFLVVNINETTREFKSLSQEDIILYSKDLIAKEPLKKQKNTTKPNINPYLDIYERGFEDNRNANQSNFENTLLNILVELEVLLTNIIKNNGEDKK